MEEPLLAKAVLLMKEGVHFQPSGGTSIDDPIVHIHAENSIW